MSTKVIYNSIKNAKKYLPKTGKLLIITDEGVPKAYAKTISKSMQNATIFTIPSGEAGKTMETVSTILNEMISLSMERGDAVVAVGGGMVTDIAGFTAGIYKRGIDFYSVPTTVLAQCDAAIGGKTGVNFDTYKNAVGLFYPAKKVLIDTELLATLPPRIFAEGMAEVVKMAVTLDRELFELIESADNVQAILPEVIRRCGELKTEIVKQDPYEKGIRKVLNFGHTFGHAIEAQAKGKYLHGECVAFGMIPMADDEVAERLEKVLMKLGISGKMAKKPTFKTLLPYLKQDKKMAGEKVHGILCHEVGTYEICALSMEELKKRWEA